MEKGEDEDENQYLLDDYESEDEGRYSKATSLGIEGLSASTKEILKKFVLSLKAFIKR